MKKVFEIDAAILEQLDLLAKDYGLLLQQVADRAFTEMLKKHGRPTTLIEALRMSLRRFPLNDNGAEKPGRKRSN